MTATKLATGTSGTVFHRLFSKRERRAYIWAMGLKPGDIINSFDAWNHEITKVEILWDTVSMCRFNSKYHWGLTPRGTYVCDVAIYSTDGWVHYISESGVIEPALSLEKLYWWHSKQAVDLALSMGIIDGRGVRVRDATDDEREMIRTKAGGCGV